MGENSDLIFQYDSKYGGQYTLKPHLGIYAYHDNLSLSFHHLDKDDGRWYPFCYATVNIIPLAYLEGAIDVNDNGNQMLEFLEANGFGECTPYCVRSGFCVYPIFKFNEDMLLKINPKVFTEYAKNFGNEVSSLDDQITAAESKTQATKQKNNIEQQR